MFYCCHKLLQDSQRPPWDDEDFRKLTLNSISVCLQDEVHDVPTAFIKTPEKSNRSIRISATPSPEPKPVNHRPQKKIVTTPNKSSSSKSHKESFQKDSPVMSSSSKEKDPLKNIRLDSRNNSEFLSNVSQHSSYKKIVQVSFQPLEFLVLTL